MWPTLDTSKELTARDRLEVLRRVRAGEANIGFVKRCIGGVSDLIGHIKPQAATKDHEWNRRAEEAFWRRAKHPLAFDQAGKLDFLGWQGAVKRSKLRDGDALTVFSEGSEGGGRIVFYEAHQVGDGKEDATKRPENLRDGVFLDKWGGRIGFRVVSMADPTMFTTVPRERAIYHAKCERVGRPREVSGIAHAVSNFLDMVEIIADTKHAVKVAALWGVAMETAAGSAGGSQVSDELRAYLDLAAGSNDGGVGEVLTLERIMQGGRVQGLPSGAKLTTLQDVRPHPNQLALLAWLVRDMAWGVGLAPEVLWDVSALNGTATRYVMAETRRFVENQLQDLERDCNRVWTYFLAKEIQAGRLDLPEGLDRWWETRWIPQADLTIDRGREGNLEKDLVEAKLRTRSEYWGRQGLDWEEEERQILVEERRLEEMRAEMAGR